MQPRVVMGRPRRWPLVLFGVVTLAAVVGWALALMLLRNAVPEWLAFIDRDPERQQLRQERDVLRSELGLQRGELDACRVGAVAEARGQVIDAEACDALRESVTRLEAESAQLREQLAFYRSIAAPEQSQAGVRIVSLTLRRQAEDGQWGYELVVLQPAQHREELNASYRISLSGRSGQTLKTLTMAPVVRPADGSADFRLRTFATLSGDIRLPSGFKPQQARVVIETVGAKGYAGKVSETFDWPKLVAAAKE